MNIIFLLISLLTTFPLMGGFLDPLNWVKTQVEPVTGKKIYVTLGGEDKQQLLTKLKEEKEEFEAEEKKFDEGIKSSLEKVSYQISLIKEKLREGKGDEYLHKKLSLLNESNQTLIDIQLSRKQTIDYLDQEIKVLEEYFKDPEFKNLTTYDAKSFYSFETIQIIGQRLADLDDTTAHLEEQKNNLSADLENKKRAAEQLARQYKEKEREQKEFGGKDEDETFDVKQRAELYDLNLKLLSHKRRLVDYKIQELKRMLALIDTKLFVVKAQRKILEEQRHIVKEGLRVEESDVLQERIELEKKKQSYLEAKEAFYFERKNLATERTRLKEQVDHWAKRLDITLGDLRDLDDMSIEPSDPKAYVSLGALINTKEQLMYVDKKIELLDAQINLEEAKFNREQVSTDIIDSWNKITNRRFRSDFDVEQEIKKYKDTIAQTEREIAVLTEKRNTATNFLNIQNKVNESLKQRIKRLDANRSLFNNHWVEYLKTKDLLIGAQGRVNEQIDVNSKIIEIYTNSVSIRNAMLKQIATITNELQAIGLRSPYAISWDGFKSFFSDLDQFRIELLNLGSAYIKHFTPASIAKKLMRGKVMNFLAFLIKLIGMFFLYLLIKSLLPLVRNRFQMVPRESGATVFYSSRFAAGILDFCNAHFTALAIWAALYVFLRFDVIPEVFPRIIFYLASIPFLLLIGTQFISYFLTFNSLHDYLFFNRENYQRVTIISTILLYATVIIFLFREAFMLVIYSKSEVTTILLAIYSVIMRLILISLIRKEDILDILPTKGSAWQFIRETIEHQFYAIYAFLVFIIVLSEPHIGYGNYVSYVLWGLILSLILLRLLLFAHNLVRRGASYIFFVGEGDVVRERFAYAKSVYGVFVITALIVLAVAAMMIGARIWGFTITFRDISDVLQTKLFTVESGTEKHEITIFSIIQIFAFVLSSFVVAFLVNHFVLKYIFDLLAVDPGVQHTVSILTHYLLVIIITILGFNKVGLGFYTLPLIASLFLWFGWAMKDYANDFVSYFIILVQRPFKIGDFIRLDTHVQGVVRKITPRSIVVRVKNSVTVIVPNSKVVSSNISNWNYSRSFIAIPDIQITVPYTVDPVEIKTILARTLDANMHILKNPRPIIWLNEFGESGFVFLIRGFLSVDNVSNQFDIASEVRLAITRALKERSIDIGAPARLYKMSE